MAARKKKKHPGRTGRPSKLTPELQERICEAIRAGNYIETSAARVGINKTTLYNWLTKGGREVTRVEAGLAKGRRCKVTAKAQPYVDFLDAIKRAEADAEARDVAIIAKAALKQWQAAAWRLERKHYSRWGRRQAIEYKPEPKQKKKVQKVKIGDREIEF